MTRPSAWQRLRELPTVFTLGTAVRCLGLSAASVKPTLSRWVRHGMIVPAGERSGVYYNCVRDPQAPETERHTAVRLLYPSATLGEASVLQAAGWTTQIPRMLTVHVKIRRSYVGLTGVHLLPRPLAWYRLLDRNSALLSPQQAAFPTYGLPAVDPAWALADMHTDPCAWHPDADDLDLDDTDEERVAHAITLLDTLRIPGPSRAKRHPTGDGPGSPGA